MDMNCYVNVKQEDLEENDIEDGYIGSTQQLVASSLPVIKNERTDEFLEPLLSHEQLRQDLHHEVEVKNEDILPVSCEQVTLSIISCNICSEQFNDVGELEKHRRLHAEKPLQCNWFGLSVHIGSSGSKYRRKIGRKYQRKVPDRRAVTNDQVNIAKLLIAKGISKRKVATQLGLKESTLRKRLKLGSGAKSLGRFALTFTKAQEVEILNYIKEHHGYFNARNMTDFRKFVYEYAETNHIPHRFNKSLRMAGKNWVYGFLERFPDLKLQQSSLTKVNSEISSQRDNTKSQTIENKPEKLELPASSSEYLPTGSNKKILLNFETTSIQPSSKPIFDVLQHRKQKTESDDNISAITAIINNLDKEQKSKTEIDDEFDIFGKYIAIQLRQMPLKDAIICREGIEAMISQKRLKLLSTQSETT